MIRKDRWGCCWSLVSWQTPDEWYYVNTCTPSAAASTLHHTLGYLLATQCYQPFVPIYTACCDNLTISGLYDNFCVRYSFHRCAAALLVRSTSWRWTDLVFTTGDWPLHASSVSLTQFYGRSSVTYEPTQFAGLIEKYKSTAHIAVSN